MCGRFALNRGLGQLRAHVNARRVVTNGRTFAPSNNIAPRDTAPIVANEEIQLMSWGLPLRGINLFNARSETVAEKFGRDVYERRCVVPADGFFEWTSNRQPHYFKRNDDEPMFLAAFYTTRGEFVILTREANDCVSKIHDRMPIILSLSQIGFWQSHHWSAMLSDKPPTLYTYPVARAPLGSGNTGEECVRPLKEGGDFKRLTAIIKSDTKTRLEKFF
jgi:putative SOS response-associated peptidase YedK